MVYFPDSQRIGLDLHIPHGDYYRIDLHTFGLCIFDYFVRSGRCYSLECYHNYYSVQQHLFGRLRGSSVGSLNLGDSQLLHGF